MTAYRVKGWSTFQHFKDRTPPWIKLYRSLLDDVQWARLSADHAKTLIMLWLLASEDETHQGALPDMAEMAWRLRMDEERLRCHVDALSHWLIRDDISMISGRYHDDNAAISLARSRETETETETEGEERREPPAPAVKHPLSNGQAMPEDGWSWDQVREAAADPTCGVIEATARTYFDARCAAGWVDAAKRDVARTRRALISDLRKWSVAEASHGKRQRTTTAPRLVNTWIDPHPDESMRKAF